jgi:hypothetical protein
MLQICTIWWGNRFSLPNSHFVWCEPKPFISHLNPNTMQKLIYTLALLLAGFTSHAQFFQMQYSFETATDALFFRYKPEDNVAMSSYVQSIQDWTELLNKEPIEVAEIYDRLRPKKMTLQGRLIGNVHLIAPHVKLTAGVSTGRYEFRNYSWHGEALFRYTFTEAAPDLSIETGFMLIKDYSFGPEAAIKTAANTPKEIKDKMRKFMTEDMFEKPTSKGLKIAAYYHLDSNFDLGINGFIDFVKRNDGARNDYASLCLRVRLEETPKAGIKQSLR